MNPPGLVRCWRCLKTWRDDGQSHLRTHTCPECSTEDIFGPDFLLGWRLDWRL